MYRKGASIKLTPLKGLAKKDIQAERRQMAESRPCRTGFKTFCGRRT
jgi:hypothetical protein